MQLSRPSFLWIYCSGSERMYCFEDERSGLGQSEWITIRGGEPGAVEPDSKVETMACKRNDQLYTVYGREGG